MSSEIKRRHFVARMFQSFLVDFLWGTVLRRIGRAAISLGTFFRSMNTEAPESSDSAASTFGLLIVLAIGMALVLAGN